MKAIVFALPGGEALAGALATALNAELGKRETRRFPDGETYLRLDSPVAGRAVVMAGSLNDPDPKLVPLLFMARTARALGAASVVLAAPYLAYMRQDRQFKPGETVASRVFADFVSGLADALVTVDPHLHRISALSEIYRIPTDVVHAAPMIGEWLRANVSSPLVIGPDEESRQWVAAVAAAAGAPFVVLEKVRHGDRSVDVSVPHVANFLYHTPVLVDDIVSTARTMIETVKHLASSRLRPPVCVAVHAIFAGAAHADLLAAGAARVVSCNTIDHPSNAIDVVPDISRALGGLLHALERPNRT